MSSTWAKRHLGEVASVASGKNLSKESRMAGAVPVYGSNGVIGVTQVPMFQDRVIAVGRVGACGAVTMTSGPAHVSDNALVVRPLSPEVDIRFLHAWLQTFDFQPLVQGTTQPMIRGGDLKMVRLSLPPVDEQRRIAGVLGALDDLIEVNRGLIRGLQDLALTRYTEVASVVTESRRLGALAAVNAAQVKPKLTGSVTYLDISSVGDAVVEWPAAMDWSAAPSRARRLASAGSTIWSTVRPNRRAHALLTHVPNDLVVSTGFAVLEPNVIGAAEIFCATHGDSFVEYLMSRAEGSAYPAVRGSVFEEAEVPFLGAEASTEFENFAWPLLGAAGELGVEARQLRATRDELLPLLVSGAVTVSEVAA